jgi:hypothetical protein
VEKDAFAQICGVKLYGAGIVVFVDADEHEVMGKAVEE